MPKHSIKANGQMFDVITTVDKNELNENIESAKAKQHEIEQGIAEIRQNIAVAEQQIEAMKDQLKYYDWFLETTKKMLK